MAIVRWILTLPIIVVSVWFAVSNRERVPVTFSPLHEPAELPVYGIALGVFIFAFLFGALVCWLSMGGLRRERRAQKKEIKKLQKELDNAHENAVKEKDTATPILIDSIPHG